MLPGFPPSVGTPGSHLMVRMHCRHIVSALPSCRRHPRQQPDPHPPARRRLAPAPLLGRRPAAGGLDVCYCHRLRAVYVHETDQPLADGPLQVCLSACLCPALSLSRTVTARGFRRMQAMPCNHAAHHATMLPMLCQR